MNSSDIEAIYPLSPMQQGMLFHSLYDPDSRDYLEQITCSLEGELNLVAFEGAWQQVAERHSIFRTSFVWRGIEQPVQVVQRQIWIPFHYEDWSGEPGRDVQACLNDYLRVDREQAFDLAKPPLFHLAVFRLATTEHVLVWTHHHILLDGWSLPLVVQEVIARYEAYQKGAPLQLPSIRPYRDFINWLKKQDLSQAEAYWRKTLNSLDAPTPLGFPEPSPITRMGADWRELESALPVETWLALQKFVQKNGLTTSAVIQAAWAYLLYRYTREEDILFGLTVSGRPASLSGSETMIGLMINTLPVRIQISPQMPILQWLKEIQWILARQSQYEYTPLVKIQEWSQIPSGTPLFHSIVVFENYPVQAEVENRTGLKFKDIRSLAHTNYPVTLVASARQNLILKLAYDAGRIDPGAAQRTLGHLGVILQQMIADPNAPIRSISLLTPEEHKQIVIEWNRNQNQTIPNYCAHQVFEAQVDQAPDAPALEMGGQLLTYTQLDRRANQLAHRLQQHGFGPESLAAVLLDRSFELIISLLAVQKAGGAFLPIDPGYPADRIAYMLEDSGASILITQAGLFQMPGLTIIDPYQPEIGYLPETRAEAKVGPQNLAYVIYTSGSTGKPKGTLLEHKGLVNLIHTQVPDFQIQPGKRVLQFASTGFDAAVAEIYHTLCGGGTLVLAPRDVLVNLPDLVSLLKSQHITTITLPPSLLALLPYEELPGLTTVISAGEACPPEIAARWLQGRTFINAYGPTETTVEAAIYQVEGDPGKYSSVPIGRPIPNTQMYVLDPDLHPLPVGIPGELHVAGVSLARGYLNQPGLTAEKFIRDPFSSDPGSRMYKTGDLVRYLPDRQLEFLGRIDQQVKLRGFRIELGEIENILVRLPGLRNAAVIVREDNPGEQRLVAYLVSTDADHPVPITELRSFLAQNLPDYMHPAAFIYLDQLPLTPNGKVNRKALPVPDQASYADSKTPFQAPRSPTEEILSEIWERLLGISPVGSTMNFFEMGGHSLLATQLASRIREAFDVEIPLKIIFENPVLSGLAAQVDRRRGSSAIKTFPPIQPVPRGVNPLPLSYSQQRLWFLDQLEPGNSFYNLPTAVRLKGWLDRQSLQKSFDEIIRRHEALRTNFQRMDGKPVQVISPPFYVEIPLMDLRDLAPEAREDAALQHAQAVAQQPFSLTAGPLIRVVLYQLEEDEFILLFVLHHIISDGWSMDILLKELTILYESFHNGLPSPLQDLTLQYADYAAWQQDWLKDRVIEDQMAYWKGQLADLSPILELPTDRPRPSIQSYRGAIQELSLPKELVSQMKAVCQKEGVTVYMLLLAVYQVLMARYTGQDDIAIGTALANRTHAEIEPLVGFFVNTLVLRGKISSETTFRAYLRQVRDTCLGAYANQDLPFEMLVDALQPERSLSHSPLFQVAFNMQSVPVDRYSLPDLEMEPLIIHNNGTSFDLFLNIGETESGLVAVMEYNLDIFHETTIQRLLRHFESLLTAALTNPNQPVHHLPLLTAEERSQMLVEWNATSRPFRDDLCAHQVFEDQVRRHPEEPALILGDQQMSYRQVDEKADHLAAYLRDLGVGPETLVGIFTERSFDSVCALLGVLKAGGAFLPLDPTYPRGRLAFMLEDSRSSILLTQAHLAELIPSTTARVVSLEEVWNAQSLHLAQAPEAAAGPDSLAYVIFTSGSTGKPKGAMLHHRGLCNLIEFQQRIFDVCPGQRILQFSSSSFDASVWETFMALGNGATLVLSKQEILASPQDIYRLLQSQRVTHATLPPSVLQVLPSESLPDLRVLVAAGEACPVELVARWAPERNFFNAYGPTETTVCASIERCNDGDSRPPSIGHPISNTQLYILDPYLEPVPIGVPGELYIGGVCVGRGYLNRPDLTAEKFVRDPFRSDPEARLYRTGDRARYRADGKIEFLERMDTQVKIRGFRIELGEIEAILTQHPGISQALVTAFAVDGGEKRLVAYLIPSDPAQKPATADLRAGIRAQLPEYMLPGHFIFLDAFPLTPSGKIDRKRLPSPSAAAKLEPKARGVEPATPTEKALLEMTEELLQTKGASIDESFFDLGGHSLLATQLITRIQEKFQVELSLRTLFEHSTLRELADCIDARRASVPVSPASQNDPLLEALKAVQEMTPEQIAEYINRPASSKQ
ncbi:MAG TPA: amino acid adenylation domain-containing protein [Anaerolineaceae bacterium]|nr:amino acid adenylation domain-containing protein [Anaerolineaceae bacterium]